MDSQNLFKWTREATKLIVEESANRKSQFRDPKTKKRDLWREIKMTFFEKGYEINEDMLDRKFRNLKKTYTEIKDKHYRTGSGRINWEYYDQFDEILFNDQAINNNVTMGSMEEVDQPESSGTEVSPCSSSYSTRKRALRDYRNEQIEIEKAKLIKLDRLIDNIERNTKIHEDRNNLFKKIIDMQTQM